MLKTLVREFLSKQKGRAIHSIAFEFLLRVVSIVAYPLVWLILLMWSQFRLVKIGFLYRERLGHLALNTDLYLRRRYLGLIPSNETHIFLVYRPANKQLVRMFSRRMTIVNSEFVAKLLSPISLFRSRFWIPLPFFGNEYPEFNAAPPQISFTEDEIERGRALLTKIGLGQDDWYACIFARDHKYYKAFSPNTDVTFSDHRNADIDTYALAIREILKAGGWVIRMGSCVEKPLAFRHPRVIDYATNWRDDFADVFITAHARFYVGTTSGASDLSVLFDVPFVGVNYVPVGCAPIGKASIYIPKRIIHAADGRQVSMREQYLAFPGNQVSAAVVPERVLAERGWIFRDNTAEEIRDVVVELMQRLDNCYVESEACRSARASYDRVLPKENFHRPNKSPIGQVMLMSLDMEDVGILAEQ
jgi:putative glycosyltransferase (TIGR04372 family)